MTIIDETDGHGRGGTDRVESALAAYASAADRLPVPPLAAVRALGEHRLRARRRATVARVLAGIAVLAVTAAVVISAVGRGNGPRPGPATLAGPGSPGLPAEWASRGSLAEDGPTAAGAVTAWDRATGVRHSSPRVLYAGDSAYGLVVFLVAGNGDGSRLGLLTSASAATSSAPSRSVSPADLRLRLDEATPADPTLAVGVLTTRLGPGSGLASTSTPVVIALAAPGVVGLAVRSTAIDMALSHGVDPDPLLVEPLPAGVDTVDSVLVNDEPAVDRNLVPDTATINPGLGDRVPAKATVLNGTTTSETITVADPSAVRAGDLVETFNGLVGVVSRVDDSAGNVTVQTLADPGLRVNAHTSIDDRAGVFAGGVPPAFSTADPGTQSGERVVVDGSAGQVTIGRTTVRRGGTFTLAPTARTSDPQYVVGS